MSANRPNILINAILMLAVSPAICAQEFDLSWFTIDGGGGYSFGGDFDLEGAIGQPDAGPVLTGGEFQLVGGFWAANSPVVAGDCNADGSVNLEDFVELAECLTGAGAPAIPECTCDDLDEDGDVDLADFAVFQVIFSAP